MLREKFSEFLKNLLPLAVVPVGFLIFTGTTVWQLDKIHSGQSGSILSIFTAAVGWGYLCLFHTVLPYYIWGNSSNDTTPFEDRILGPEIGLSIRFSLEEIQKVFYNILKKIPANL